MRPEGVCSGGVGSVPRGSAAAVLVSGMCDATATVVSSSQKLTFTLSCRAVPCYACRQALQRLTEAAEKAKIELSALPQTSINLPFITATADGPKHIDTTLTRAQFEKLCGDLLERVKRPVEQALRDAKLDIKDIAEVILVGGSTRIPAVQVRCWKGGLGDTTTLDWGAGLGCIYTAAWVAGAP